MPADVGLGTLGSLGVPPRMPGRGRWLAWCWGSPAVSIAVWATVVVVDVTAVVLVILPVTQLILVGVTSVARRVRLRALLTDRRYRTVTGTLHADVLRADMVRADVLRAAGPSGVRELTVRVGPVGGFARCFRAGDRAVLLVHERLPVRPDAARFMIAHEAAHLARYDVLRRSSAFTTALVCCSCLATVWPAALVPGVLGVIATFLGLNRAAELGCDRLAARWTGPAPAEQAMALVQAAYGHSLRSLLTHPSPRRRLAACRAATDRLNT